MSPQWKFKLATSVLVALISTLYQLETDDELLVTNKKVLLSKNISRVFTALSDLEEYPSVKFQLHYLSFLAYLQLS